MNHDDYESLPTTSVGINMTAGALAGILEHIVMYPLDSVKVSTTTTTTNVLYQLVPIAGVPCNRRQCINIAHITSQLRIFQFHRCLCVRVCVCFRLVARHNRDVIPLKLFTASLCARCLFKQPVLKGGRQGLPGTEDVSRLRVITAQLVILASCYLTHSGLVQPGAYQSTFLDKISGVSYLPPSHLALSCCLVAKLSQA